MIQKKIKGLPALEKIAAAAKKQGKRIVTTNGCFDIMHAGHVKTLEWAKAQGDILIVGVNSDSSVRQNKNPLRPIVAQKYRAAMLGALACTDYVLIFSTKSPIPWLKKIKPQVHVKGHGSETSPVFTPEKEAVEKLGGKVLLAPKIQGLSTTTIIKKIVRAYPDKK
jgi:D-beta-D-heptose 7-phosphate kinase / D-beta-D-heptose 1-phosphate adenosyltransferase